MLVLHKIAMSLALAGVGAAGVHAQGTATYNCFTKEGGSYTSSRACPKGTTAGPVYYGPAAERQTSYSSGSNVGSSYKSSTAPEADHVKYLSSQCRSLYDGIRNADTNGAKYDVKSRLQSDYSRQCSDEESDARSKISKERYDSKKERQDSAKLQQKQADGDKSRTAAHYERCAESRRILNTKKARTDLNDGEKAELRRFEENYINRCS